MITTQQEKRVKKDWEVIAKETLDIKIIDDTIYAFCSEIASLRLLKAFRNTDKADCGFSVNTGNFYFRLETNE